MADPGLPTRVVDRLASNLSGILSSRVSADVSWDVRVISGPLPIAPLDDHRGIPLLDVSYQPAPGGQRVDLMICLTDLPRRMGAQPIVSDVSVAHNAALVSPPGLGGMRVLARARELIVYLIGEIVGQQVKRGEDRGRRRGHVRRVEPTGDAMDTRLVVTGMRGRVRLLPSLASAIDAAIAVASFGLLFSTVWSLSDAIHPARLAFVMVLACRCCERRDKPAWRRR